MMGYGAGAWFGVGGWLTLLGCIALVVGLVLLAAWALGKVGATADGAKSIPSPGPASPDAGEILRQRFARGEITADEYRAAAQTLAADR